MKLRFLFFLLLIFSFLEGSQPLLKERLKEANEGDYVVLCQNKNYILLHVMGREENQITFQEVTVPIARFGKQNRSFKEWMEQGAKRNTSWSIFTINTESGSIVDFFSVGQNCRMEIPKAESFLSTLLTLELTEINERERKKVGPPPLFKGKDTRPLWTPKFSHNGTEVKDLPFTAYQSIWPEDESELSGRLIELYLPSHQEAIYPLFFPYWLQVSGFQGKAKARIVATGTDLKTDNLPLAYKRKL